MRVRSLLLTSLAAATAVALPSTASAATNNNSAQLPPVYITGTGNGAAPHVKVFTTPDQELSGLYDHNPAQATGVRVASGDVDGDLKADLITATGPGTAGVVTVRTMAGALMGSFTPYGGFTGGLNIASGDVDGDTHAEIVVAQDAGAGPNVSVWDFDSGVAKKKYDWFAYDGAFKGGVNIAVAHLVGSTKDDIVTGPGPGGGPHVRVWDVGSGQPVENNGFFAYAPSWSGGVKVSAGDMDGQPMIVTGAGPGGGAHVRQFTSKGVLKGEFFAYSGGYNGGVNVAVVASLGGDLGYILTAPIRNGGPHVRGFRANGQALNISFFAYNAAMNNGVTIAAVPTLGGSNDINQNQN